MIKEHEKNNNNNKKRLPNFNSPHLNQKRGSFNGPQKKRQNIV